MKRIFIQIWVGLLLLLCAEQVRGQNKRLFDYNEGLSNSLINQVQQDGFGFIWVATENGLNRFDGQRFVSYTQDKKKPGSLKASFVRALLQDTQGNLWVGQMNGLQVYDHNTETFEEIEFYIDNERVHPYVSALRETRNGDIWVVTSGFGLFQIPAKTGRPRYSTRLNKQFNSLYLQSICEDREGVLWIGSFNVGLNTYDPNTDEVRSFSAETQGAGRLLHNDISTICEDDSGNVYLGSIEGSLLRFDRKKRAFETVYSKEKDKESVSIKSLLFDSKQTLWVGTDGNGLKRLNRKTGKLESYSPPSSSFDFSKSKVHSITEDDAGNLWLGIFQKGLYLLPEAPELFKHYGYKAFGDQSIGSSCITSIDGTVNELWIGTDGDGVYRYDRTRDEVEHIELRNVGGNALGSNVMSLYNTQDRLWVGTYFNGLLAYDKVTGKSVAFKDLNRPNGEVNDKISVVKPGEKNELWLGTLGWGLCRFDIDSKLFYRGLDLPDSVNAQIPKWVNDFCVDRNSNIWVGTYDGLIYVDRKAMTVKTFSEKSGFFPNNLVYCVKIDHSGMLWVGVYGGLVRIDPNTFNTEFFDESDGLCSNVVCAILEDGNEKLWLSTHNGLSHFDPVTGVFTNYYASDGIQANEFYKNSAFINSDSALFFGGINGVTEVKKDYQGGARTIRGVMLTDFLRFDKSVSIGDKSGDYTILNKAIVLADTVELAERDNVFSIGFNSVELANQSRISYQYRLDGFDLNWNLSKPTNHLVTYTNLKHGTYTFWVRGEDKGQYSEIRKLTIIIHPPWYKTSWANVLWILIAGTLLWGMFRLNHEKLMREEAEKLNEKKMQFFINVSHEIRTPLTLIIDPLNKLLSKNVDGATARVYNTMQQNANRIYRLVNQLLDVRKIDKGQIFIKFQKTNLYAFTKEIAQSYELVAADKEIDFRIEASDANVEAWIDPLNFEKVILNLLSNAFKFSPNGTQVKVRIELSVDKKYVRIVVCDKGIGLKKADLERVFERFYQVESKETRNNAGTGIGLHLSRSLVNLHKGKLYATLNEDGQGCSFIIDLPLGNAHLPERDLILEENRLTSTTRLIEHKRIPEKPIVPSNKKKKHNATLLIVDDDDEIRNYLMHEFSELYHVVACENGRVAFEKLSSLQPDLIISDIMMPEMDGIALCKKVKSNTETSHIPVILLTALSRDEDKAEGIETGADMYLVKPFNSDFLKLTVANIFTNRKRLMGKAGVSNTRYDLAPPEVKSHDEQLMQKIMQIVKDNLSNGELNVEMLAEGVGISRVHLHRRLKEITQQSARDFIKGIRMKQASYLLINKDLNVSEVAYAVGYSNLSHFSTTFKGYYGVSPTEYMAQKNEVDVRGGEEGGLG